MEVTKPLAVEFEVGLQILDSKSLTFSKLVKILDGRISRNKISVALDRLSDLGLIKESWEQDKEDKTWGRQIMLTSEGKPLMQEVYKAVIKAEPPA